MRPAMYPAATWRNPRLPVYARPGIEMNVSALVSEATIENMTAHQGSERSATKYFCASFWFLPSQTPRTVVPARYATRTAKSTAPNPLAGKSAIPAYAEKELPQPQPPVAFGFLKVKPDPCMDVT